MISSAIDEDNPELAAARAAGLAVWARQQAIAAVAASHRVDRGRGHDREDDDHVDDRDDPRSRRPGSDVPDRRRPERERERRERGERRRVPLRGRRERRLVPPGRPRDRRRDERRGRSRRLLSRRRGGAAPGVRGVLRPLGAARRLCRRCRSTRGRPPRGRATDPVRHGGRRGSPPDGRHPRSRGRPRIPPRRRRGGRRCPCGSTAPTTSWTRRPRSPSRGWSASRHTMPRGRSPPSPASTVASRSAVRVRGARFFDDYAHVPTELAVTLAVARARQPGRAGRGVPAASLLEDAGALARARRRAHRGRPRRRDRRLRREPGPDPGGDGCPRGRWRPGGGPRPGGGLRASPRGGDRVPRRRGACRRPRDHARLRRHLDGGRRGARTDRGGGRRA